MFCAYSTSVMLTCGQLGGGTWTHREVLKEACRTLNVNWTVFSAGCLTHTHTLEQSHSAHRDMNACAHTHTHTRTHSVSSPTHTPHRVASFHWSGLVSTMPPFILGGMWLFGGREAPPPHLHTHTHTHKHTPVKSSLFKNKIINQGRCAAVRGPGKLPELSHGGDYCVCEIAGYDWALQIMCPVSLLSIQTSTNKDCRWTAFCLLLAFKLKVY